MENLCCTVRRKELHVMALDGIFYYLALLCCVLCLRGGAVETGVAGSRHVLALPHHVITIIIINVMTASDSLSFFMFTVTLH